MCGSRHVSAFYRESGKRNIERDYLLCQQCALVFVPACQFISAAQEKTHYDLHQNNPADQNYRRFLSQLLTPMQEKLHPGACGLDFGCGPGPTLSLMFEELGYRMNIYDYFYANNEHALQQTYDFITATETVEHLHYPKTEMEKLWGLLKPGGHLGIMTNLLNNREAFKDWYYKNDPTHVCFFSKATFHWLAASWHAKIEFAGNNVVLFEKPRGTAT
ncbi:MAG: class I SAM-dependent methyltransferase [Gammaproteobacteria bacterium]|nr:class I SAM-dependent methyltransferase [Gammaproteobacteria bacterium]